MRLMATGLLSQLVTLTPRRISEVVLPQLTICRLSLGGGGKGVGVPDAVWVGEIVGEWLKVGLTLKVGLSLKVGEIVGEAEKVTVAVGVGEAVRDALKVGVMVPVLDAVLVAVAVSPAQSAFRISMAWATGES
jgi:hypothetical protein